MTQSAAETPQLRVWRFVGGIAVSNVADGMLRFGLPLAAALTTRSGTDVGLVVGAAGLPWLLVAPFTGAFLDRVDKLRAIIATTIIRSIGCLTLAAVIDRHSPFVLLVCAAFGFGISETIVDTGSLAIAGEQRSDSNVSMARVLAWIYGSQLTSAELAGPLIAGALAASNGRLLFLTAGALYAVVGVALTRGASRAASDNTPHNPFSLAFLLAGFHAIVSNRQLRTAVGLDIASYLMFAIWQVAFVIYALRAGGLHWSSTTYGALFAVAAIGGIAGTGLANRIIATIGEVHAIQLGILGWAIFLCSPIARTLIPVGTLMFVGWGLGATGSIATSLVRQRSVAPTSLGRVNAAARTLTWGTAPLGALIAAGLISSSSDTTTIWICGGVTAGVAVLTHLPHITRSLAGRPTATAPLFRMADPRIPEPE